MFRHTQYYRIKNCEWQKHIDKYILPKQGDGLICGKCLSFHVYHITMNGYVHICDDHKRF